MNLTDDKKYLQEMRLSRSYLRFLYSFWGARFKEGSKKRSGKKVKTWSSVQTTMSSRNQLPENVPLVGRARYDRGKVRKGGSEGDIEERRRITRAVVVFGREANLIIQGKKTKSKKKRRGTQNQNVGQTRRNGYCELIQVKEWKS